MEGWVCRKKPPPIINSKMLCNNHPVNTGYFVMTTPIMVYTDNEDISGETQFVNNRWVRTNIVRNIVFSGHNN